MNAIRDQIERIVTSASNGAVTAEMLHKADGVLSKAGVDSMMILAIIELIEKTFAVIVESDVDPTFIESVDSIERFVRAQTGTEVQHVH